MSRITEKLCTLAETGRIGILVVLGSILASTMTVAAQPFEYVWSNSPSPFRATAVDSIRVGSSDNRRVVTVGREEPGVSNQDHALMITVWGKQGQFARNRWMISGIPKLYPTSVRELSTGEFLVAGHFQNTQYGAHWFVAVFDGQTLSPTQFYFGLGGSYLPGAKVIADELSNGDIIVATAARYGRLTMVRLERITGQLQLNPTHMKLYKHGGSSGGQLTVNDLHITHDDRIVVAGRISGGIAWSPTGSGFVSVLSDTLTPVASTAIAAFSAINAIAITQNDIYLAGSYSDFVYSPNSIPPWSFQVRMHAASMPLTLNQIHWNQGIGPRQIVPTSAALNMNASGGDLWITGSNPGGTTAELVRLSASNGLPISSIQFRQADRAGLLGVAIDHGGVEAVPVAVGHRADGISPTTPTYALFVRGDRTGLTTCALLNPISPESRHASLDAFPLVDGSIPNVVEFMFIFYDWGHAGLDHCVVFIGTPPPYPYCNGFIACEVPCAIDLNSDGIADIADIFEFLELFTASNLAADFDGNGILDFADVVRFIELFDLGCQ